MENNKTLYYICAWIPNDENVIAKQIFRLTRIGNQKGYKFIWIDIDGGIQGGVGTSIDLQEVGSDSIEKALIQLIKIVGTTYDKYFLDELTLDEAYLKAKYFEEELQKELKS